MTHSQDGAGSYRIETDIASMVPTTRLDVSVYGHSVLRM